jgi:hypothetical protein
MHKILVQRVGELVQSQKRQLLSTTAPTPVTIEELVERVEMLERVVLEIAVELEKLSGSLEPPPLNDTVARRFRRNI